MKVKPFFAVCKIMFLDIRISDIDVTKWNTPRKLETEI